METLRIAIDIYSGRPNPVIELTGNEAKEALERLRPVRKLERDEARFPSEPTLGYRGMIIEQLGEPVRGLPKTFRLAHGDLFGPRLAHRAADETFEEFICGTAGPIRRLDIRPKEVDLIKKDIERFREARLAWPVAIEKIWPPIFNPCRCAPVYEPTWWNVPAIQPNNNCYNYATNYRSNTFAQPGKAAGAMYTSLTCAAVKAAAIKDELVDKPDADNKCPGKGHLVALVVWPGGDFHWYRKGTNGYWSHKPGGTAVTNLDNSGGTIPDPRTANRGPYTDFCTFMVVMHGHIRIS